MAYDHTQYEVMVVTDGDFASLGQIGTWAPGLVPHVIRAVSVIAVNPVGAAGQIVFEYGVAGSSTNDWANINVPNGLSAASGIYIDENTTDFAPLTLSPGQELSVTVTDTGAAGDVVHCFILVEPVWETLANNSSMTLDTTMT